MEVYGMMLKAPMRVASQQTKAAEESRQMDYMLERNRGALPRWTEERFLTCDKLALHHGKRMVLWDDECGGFCLWLNWDWAANRPAFIDPDDKRSREPGWYQNVKDMFQAPLLDASVGEAGLGEWLDANTMRCHAKLLPLLQHARRGEAADGPAWVLDDAYQAVLDALPFEHDE